MRGEYMHHHIAEKRCARGSGLQGAPMIRGDMIQHSWVGLRLGATEKKGPLVGLASKISSYNAPRLRQRFATIASQSTTTAVHGDGSKVSILYTPLPTAAFEDY